MNIIGIHLEGEESAINVSGEKVSFGEKYRVLYLGEGTTVFLSPDQAEELFDKLDSQLHNKTWVQMEETALGLEVDLEEANETIQFYRDEAEERQAI